MEQNKAERLNENVTEKMCSSDGNVVGEMCSPADADTCGECGLFAEGKGVKDMAIFGENGWGFYFRRAMI